MTRQFYEPTRTDLARLAEPWCASFSGGKDSTALVTWLEWLRRKGWVSAPTPKLVRSDTGVEEPGLTAFAEALADLLTKSGWECAVVQPEARERLYPQILGRGVPPIHPGIRRMRWCTRATKIDPMDRWKDGVGVTLTLTGLRIGESKMRDGKLMGCAAGGECGIPDPGPGRYSPLLRWKTCNVVEWLCGAYQSEGMEDVFGLTAQLVELYQFMRAKTLLEDREIVSAARFGCVGCPAIGAEASAPRSVVRRYGVGSPLLELYDVWHEARDGRNRLVRVRGGKAVMGPVRMEARKRLFDRVMDIQRRSGVVLVRPEDEAFIRRCWAEGVYPRGWSAADEATVTPAGPLFEGVEGMEAVP